MGLRANRDILGALKSALKAAKRERCGVDTEHQEAMRLYLDSWVVAPLEAAIAAMEGDKSWANSSYLHAISASKN